MAAKRLKRKRPKWPSSLLRPPDPPVETPQAVTCPACGATAQITDHTCPHCGQLFYERPNGHVGRERGNGTARADAEIAKFAERMETIEHWARIICVIAGILFGLLTILLVAALGALPMGLGARAIIAAAFICAVISAACLQRGLGRRPADVDGLDH